MNYWQVLLFATCLVAFSEMKPLKSISEDMEIIVKCNASFPVAKKTLNMALVEKRFEDHVSHNFKCFLHCLYQRYEWMDADGNIRHQVMRLGLSESTLGDPAIKYLISACSENREEHKCEKAFTFTQCFWRENSKLVSTDLPTPPPSQKSLGRTFMVVRMGMDELKSSNFKNME